MSFRLATLLTAATIVLGGCAQSHMSAVTADLAAFSYIDPPKSSVYVAADKVSDEPADAARPVKTAAWGEADVQATRENVTGWRDTTIEKEPVSTAAVEAPQPADDKPAAKAADSPREAAGGWRTETVP